MPQKSDALPGAQSRHWSPGAHKVPLWAICHVENGARAVKIIDTRVGVGHDITRAHFLKIDLISIGCMLASECK